jgi:polyphosphate kinase 2 (PPK2 family)
MDASGKDSTIRHVFGHLNPQGVMVQLLKCRLLWSCPRFLWSIRQHTPAKGMIQIFNRSHYEDVIVTRVHKSIPEEMAYKRMMAVNNFEEMLTEHTHTHTLKFSLHVSHAEQLKHLNERINDKTKQWKYNEDDIVEQITLRSTGKFMKIVSNIVTKFHGQ